MESSAGGIEGHSHYRLYDKFTGGLNPALAATTLERPAAGATGAAALIDLYRVPLMFRLYKNGSLINSEYTHFANCFVSEAFNSRANTFYRLNLLPEKGSNEIILAPGEHVVLSASNHVKTYENQFSVKGLDLRPGFELPASPRRVGGIELDYGNQEPEYLPPFSTNDLPSVVVSGDIPKNAAGDSYQGTKPPPAVRFKEPFLITTFHLKTAAYLLIDSPLNVNSTRVDVWEAVLASNFGGTVPQIRNGGLIAATGDDTAFSRHLPGNGAAFEAAPDPLSQDLAKWNGHRRLTKPQIRRLAEEIVVEIQERGPFQSIAEVVNRRPDSGPLGNAGALQAALDRAKINHDALSTAIGAGNGTTADGAPGVLTQADLLTAIAPTLTARGDTFRIRAYGEAGPANGPKVTAWCEAVVQRAPEYLDAGDQPWATPIRPINTRFGRRYEIVSFRWLASSEI